MVAAHTEPPPESPNSATYPLHSHTAPVDTMDGAHKWSPLAHLQGLPSAATTAASGLSVFLPLAVRGGSTSAG